MKAFGSCSRMLSQHIHQSDSNKTNSETLGPAPHPLIHNFRPLAHLPAIDIPKLTLIHTNIELHQSRKTYIRLPTPSPRAAAYRRLASFFAGRPGGGVSLGLSGRLDASSPLKFGRHMGSSDHKTTLVQNPMAGCF